MEEKLRKKNAKKKCSAVPTESVRGEERGERTKNPSSKKEKVPKRKILEPGESAGEQPF